MCIDQLALRSLEALFGKLSLKIRDFSMNETHFLVSQDSLIHVFKYCYHKLNFVCSNKHSLIGKSVDILKLILDSFLDPISSLDKMIVLESSIDVYADVVRNIGESKDILDRYKYCDLLVHILGVTDIEVVAKLGSLVFPILEMHLFDPVLYLSFDVLHHEILVQIERIKPEAADEFKSTKELIQSMTLLQEMISDTEANRVLSSAKEHIHRLQRILPTLESKPEKNVIERFMHELFIASEFVEDISQCQTMLKQLLAHKNSDIRQFTIQFIADDQQFFLDKLVSEDMIYLICLHAAGSSESLQPILDIIQYSSETIRLFFPFIPLLQCSITYNENITKEEKSEELMMTLQLFERLMTSGDTILYHIRYLFHKYKWIREAAATNLKTILTQETTPNLDFEEMDPFISIYMDEVSQLFERSNIDIQDQDLDNLLVLFKETNDMNILSSVTLQLLSIVNGKFSDWL